MAKSPEALYAEVKQKSKGCTLAKIEKLLQAWRFRKRKERGNTQVWAYRHITLTLHRPHKQFLPVGAVSQVLACIDEARLLIEAEYGNGPIN